MTGLLVDTVLTIRNLSLCLYSFFELLSVVDSLSEALEVWTALPTTSGNKADLLTVQQYLLL